MDKNQTPSFAVSSHQPTNRYGSMVHLPREGTIFSRGIYFTASVYLTCCFIACFILEPTLTLCDETNTNTDGDDRFENPAYTHVACHTTRFPHLFYLTIQECSFGRRMMTAVIFGGLIGWERRREDRPAGIRTMCLVSLGSCLFCICSTFAFSSGPMTWDAARVSAAIPSGVGFLGAGLIFKNAEKNEFGDVEHTVHGITTAISLWISAAVGIACGGQLYFAASYTVGVMMLLLRFGPRADDNDNEVIDPMDPATLPSKFVPTMIGEDFENQSLASLSFDDLTQLLPKTKNSASLRMSNITTTSLRPCKSRPQLME